MIMNTGLSDKIYENLNVNVEPFRTLSDIVPLRTPLGITISVGNICDFHCKFCIAKKIVNQSKPYLMSMEDFSKITDQIKEFGEPIKQITFVSDGETILNDNLPKMIQEVKKQNLAGSVKVTSNGNRLTPEYSKRLIDAGLDALKISMEGFSTEEYIQFCNPPKAFQFERFVDQIRYFSTIRGHCKLYLQIFDLSLKGKDKKKILGLFEDMADAIVISDCIDYEQYYPYSKTGKCVEAPTDVNLCPWPFYFISLDCYGNLYPCCHRKYLSPHFEYALGNIKENSMKSIWENQFKKLQYDLLTGQLAQESICHGCTIFRDKMPEQNRLDNKKQVILNRYQVDASFYGNEEGCLK